MLIKSELFGTELVWLFFFNNGVTNNKRLDAKGFLVYKAEIFDPRMAYLRMLLFTYFA